MKVELHDGISVLIRRGKGSRFFLSCEDRKRRWPAVDQKRALGPPPEAGHAPFQRPEL